MAAKNKSDMDISYPNWSKVLLNDSNELRRKQKRQTERKYSRRLFSKLKNSPTPKKFRSKPTFYQRYMAKPKMSSPSQQKEPKTSKPNIGNEWKKEYDVWNMIVQALDQSLLNNHKIHWPNKVFGIRDSNDKIRLIQNRDELQQEILVAPTGLKTHLKDLLNANDSTDDISLKMNFKLVPVVENLIIVNKSTETSYKFADDDNEINNNDMECENSEIEHAEIKREKWEDDDTLINFVNNHESTGNISHDKTLTNTSCSTWDYSELINHESTGNSTYEKTLTNTSCSTWEYSEFCDDIEPAASSTFISGEMENSPCLSHEKENIPLLSFPESKPSLDSKTFFDSPIPCFARKHQIPDDFEPGLHDLQQIMEHCKNTRTSLQMLYNKVNVIEDRCISWLRQKNNLMSGIDFLPDLIEF